MLGNELTSISGQFPLVNEGGYSSEYRMKDGTTIKTIRVRHSKEKPQQDGVIMDRHNVEITFTFPASVEYPNGYSYQTYIICRHPPGVDLADVKDQSLELSSLLHGAAHADPEILMKVLGWES